MLPTGELGRGLIQPWLKVSHYSKSIDWFRSLKWSLTIKYQHTYIERPHQAQKNNTYPIPAAFWLVMGSHFYTESATTNLRWMPG